MFVLLYFITSINLSAFVCHILYNLKVKHTVNKLAQTGNEIKETIRETLYSFYALDLYGGTGVGQEGEERMAESLSPLKKKKPAQEAVI